jgi:hypothetical protein
LISNFSDRTWAGATLFSIKIFSSRFRFRDQDITLIEYIRGKVLLGQGFCPHTNLTATGIPGHLRQAEEIRELRSTVDSLIEQILPGMERRLQGRLESMPDSLKENLLANFRLEGVLPVRLENIERIIDRSLQHHLGATHMSRIDNVEMVTEEINVDVGDIMALGRQISIGLENGIIGSYQTIIDIEDDMEARERVFNSMLEKLVHQLYGQVNRRPFELTYNTLYNRLHKRQREA